MGWTWIVGGVHDTLGTFYARKCHELKITSSTSRIYDHELEEVHSVMSSLSSPYVDVATWVHQIRFFINWTSSHEVRKSITALKLRLRSLRCALYEQDIFS